MLRNNSHFRVGDCAAGRRCACGGPADQEGSAGLRSAAAGRQLDGLLHRRERRLRRRPVQVSASPGLLTTANSVSERQRQRHPHFERLPRRRASRLQLAVRHVLGRRRRSGHRRDFDHREGQPRTPPAISRAWIRCRRRPPPSPNSPISAPRALRLGYLITPQFLVFGTGGLAFGQVKTSANVSYSYNGRGERFARSVEEHDTTSAGRWAPASSTRSTRTGASRPSTCTSISASKTLLNGGDTTAKTAATATP